MFAPASSGPRDNRETLPQGMIVRRKEPSFRRFFECRGIREAPFALEIIAFYGKSFLNRLIRANH